MPDKKPFLSICIPTYNRATHLEKTIQSIITQPVFSRGEIELVISDNFSTDDTERVAKLYSSQNKNILYSRNTQNIHDKNFPKVVSLAHGVYRKLYNDTAIFKNNSLEVLLETVKMNMEKRPVLCFANRNIKGLNKKNYNTYNFDEFVRIVSFWSTWIGLFGIWEEDLSKLSNLEAGCELSLWQTTVLFEMVSTKKHVVINNQAIVNLQEVEKKDLRYGIFKVFGQNYLSLYKQFLTDQNLSKNIFRTEKRKLLFNFFVTWYVEYTMQNTKYLLNELEKPQLILDNIYAHEWYYPLFRYRVRVTAIIRRKKEKIKCLLLWFIKLK
jgi:glycosyltransferase involved in cell wall biosynthesis